MYLRLKTSDQVFIFDQLWHWRLPWKGRYDWPSPVSWQSHTLGLPITVYFQHPKHICCHPSKLVNLIKSWKYLPTYVKKPLLKTKGEYKGMVYTKHSVLSPGQTASVRDHVLGTDTYTILKGLRLMFLTFSGLLSSLNLSFLQQSLPGNSEPIQKMSWLTE